MTNEEIRYKWLQGTTCACKPKDVREVVFANSTHIVLRHRAHAEYIGRFSPSVNCHSYAHLYVKADLQTAMKERRTWELKPLREWTGRLNFNLIWTDCLNAGIVFKARIK